MSSVLITGLTTMTTISAITLSDDFSLHDLLDNVRELGCLINSWLPKNLLIRSLFYGAGTVIGLRMIPFILRKTKFFYNVEIQSRYFHRSTFHPALIEIKQELLNGLNWQELPTNWDEKLVVLELNAGGGSNISYYPDGCLYIATDHWEGAKYYLEQNFASEESSKRISYDRFLHTIPDRLISIPDSSVSAVVSFHSLCSSSNLSLALLEIRRVLMPGGKLVFIEHVPAKRKYSFLWLSQLNFAIHFLMWNCYTYDTRSYLDKVGFTLVDIHEKEIDFKGIRLHGPLKALNPHIYGIAVK